MTAAWAGKIGAEYKVLSHTNLNGLSIPSAAKLEVMWPGIGVNQKNAHPAQIFAISATDVQWITPAEVSSPPDPPGTVSVSDYRFFSTNANQLVEQLQYRVSGHKWKRLDDPELQKTFFVHKSGSTRPPSAISSRKRLIVLAILILSALAAVAGLWSHLRNRSHSG